MKGCRFQRKIGVGTSSLFFPCIEGTIKIFIFADFFVFLQKKKPKMKILKIEKAGRPSGGRAHKKGHRVNGYIMLTRRPFSVGILKLQF